MSHSNFGEVKVKKSLFPADAREIIKKQPDVKIVIAQTILSQKTKDILISGGITLYEDVQPEQVNRIRDSLKDKDPEPQESE